MMRHVADFDLMSVFDGDSRGSVPVQSIGDQQNMPELAWPAAPRPSPFTRCHSEEAAELHAWVETPN